MFQTRSLIFLLVIFFQAIKGDTDCNDYRECYDDEIDDTSITCDGYESCASSQLDFTSEVTCGGYLGCSGSVVESSTGTVECSGYEACQTSNITSEGLVCDGSSGCDDFRGDVDGDIECNGYEGCEDSYIYVRPDNDNGRRKIYIRGSRAGRNLYLKLKGNSYKYAIHVMGYYGFENGTIWSGQGNNVNIHFYGYYSGYNAKLFCRKNADCEVTCYGDYACVGFTKSCTSQATCSVSYDYADEDYSNTKIESFDRLLAPPKHKKSKKLSKKSLSSKDIKKDSITGNYGCYDYESCAGDTISDVTGNAECYGYESCYGSDITVTGDIECNNYYSCGDASVDATDLVCEGPYSCSSTTGSISGDLSCNGYYGCDGSTVSVSGDISFNGAFSGNNVVFQFDDDSGSHSIWLGGYYALQNGVILSGEDNTINVTFDGRFAGYDGIFACDMNSICYVTCIDYGCVELDLQEYYGAAVELTCVGNAYCPDIDDVGAISKLTHKKLNLNTSFLNGYISQDILNFISQNIWSISLILIFGSLLTIGMMNKYKNKDAQYQPLPEN